MIRTEHRGAVALVTLDRPERRNAVNHEALTALRAAVDEAVDAGTRVMVLTGADGHFCAGADLSDVEDEGFVASLHELLLSLRRAPFPTMAAVEGFALGAGTQLAAACDLRVASATAGFGVPAAKLGLMVDQWTVRTLVDLVGQSVAREMLLSADVMTGERAWAVGLVHRLGSLDDALTWAERIARLAPLTLQGFKVGLDEAADADHTTPAYREAFERAWTSADFAEGLAAFGDKRTPTFEGR
ncbi:enoyl-CoA hydratase [Rhabdothermincola salaria]|uniref:enoyl-CoA hydratase n=1 Tax=Rhabdothermincola salaria TaxID=2903142 RepID=UPI001E3E09AC|nr:enoyl-CoA hydratase [Rhabdothermincola salaria]MCD9625128.1 enoyl-CoA hydratase [Rhabdothermincola salaria]